MSVYKRLYATPWGKQTIDQLGHIFLGFIITLPWLMIPYPGWRIFLAAGLSAGLAGVAREIAQMRKARKGWYMDRTIDSLFHIPGGLLLALISCIRE